METVIDRVVAAAGRYEGTGEHAERGACAVTIEVRPVADGMGAEIVCVATAADGTVVHREHTLLAFDMWSGEATLSVLCAELNGLGRLTQTSETLSGSGAATVSTTSFSNGLGLDGFDVGIDLHLRARELEYVWSWSPPGEPLTTRLRVAAHRVDA